VAGVSPREGVQSMVRTGFKGRFLIVLAALATVVLPLRAATFVVPNDDNLVSVSDSIVVGTVIDTYARRAGEGLIQTVTEVAIEETIKGGSAARVVRIVEWGGHLGSEWMTQSGAPQYTRGERVLLFLDRTGNASEWHTWGLALGAFRFERDLDGTALLTRQSEIFGFDEDGSEHVERPRLEKPFLDFVRAEARGEKASTLNYIAPEPLAQPQSAKLKVRTNDTYTGSGYVIRFGSDPARRQDNNLSVAWRLIGSQNGANLETSVDFALPKWNNQSPKIDYSKSGTPATGTAIGADAESRIVANDPNGVVTGSCCGGGGGVVATAFEYCSGPNCDFFTFNGEQFLSITHSDIVVNDITSGLSQASLNVAMTHELGHTLALRHSNTDSGNTACAPPLDCCINTGAGGNCKAIMNSSVISSLTALGQWDKNAIDCLYDGTCASSDSCTAPAITTNPSNKSISSGQSTSLTVAASGTTPTYQWYIGSLNTDESNPIGGATSTTLNISPTSTTSYWAKATNSCGVARSNVATVTVSTCSSPNITTHPQSKTIAAGATTSLSVVATGTAPLSYQWYIGTSGDTSTPTGSNSSTLSNLSPSSTTSYWVRVTGQCAPADDSNTATITVQACVPPSITTQPSNKTVSLGSSAKMTVVATGTAPFTYQWYLGNSGDTSNPIAGATTSSPNITLNATGNVWVRVTGQCAPAVDSNAATITVNPCPDVVVGTPTATGAGTNWTLNVTASSLASGVLTYEWYRGSNPGGNGTKVGEGSSLPVVVNTLTQFWARVTNSCGASKVSDLVVVAPCQLPVISAQPADRTIAKNGTTTLTVGVTGDGITTQWYQGSAPDKTTPVGAGTSINVGPLQQTTSYWAGLTNSCGEISTRTVIVTVDESCSLASITTQPADRTVAAGASPELSVAFTGDGVTVQWYRGTAPDKTNAVGSGAAITVGPILATTQFWAALTNSCGEVQSRTVTVAVEGSCTAPQITTQPQSQQVSVGDGATLGVVATGTPVLRYQWYEGTSGVTTKPVGTDSPVYVTPSILVATNYWVKVSNACGEASSATAQISLPKARRRAVRK